MKSRWTVIKTVLLLGALPLVATAAASAHQWLSDTSPISIDGVVSSQNDQLSSARIHSVALNRAGAIEGRIASIDADTRENSGLSELKIYFVQDGKIAKETITNDDGTFVVDGVAEGAYSFVATGKTGFAAYGVRVVAYDGSQQVNTMEAAAVSPQFSAVKKILEDKLPLEIAEQILSDNDVNSEQVVGANRVRLQNGNLKGHVIPMIGKVDSVKGTYVHILKDDESIAEVQADETGSFTVPDLTPGVYGFVAAGENGFAAVSFEVVLEDEKVGSVADLIDTEEVPVGLPGSVEPQDAMAADIPLDSGAVVADSMDVSLTSGQDSAFVGDQLSYGGGEYYDDIAYSSGGGEIEYAGESIGAGCAAGGSCGSSGDFSGYSSCNTCGGGGGGAVVGGGYGGGRFGRIVGIAALGIGIAALATNGNGNRGGGGFPPPPPPQSPYVPPNYGGDYGGYDNYYGGGYDNYYGGYGGYDNYGGGYNNNNYGGGYNNNNYGY